MTITKSKAQPEEPCDKSWLSRIGRTIRKQSSMTASGHGRTSARSLRCPLWVHIP